MSVFHSQIELRSGTVTNPFLSYSGFLFLYLVRHRERQETGLAMDAFVYRCQGTFSVAAKKIYLMSSLIIDSRLHRQEQRTSTEDAINTKRGVSPPKKR